MIFQKMSKKISIVLALLMVLGLLAPTSVLGAPSDIGGHWAEDVINQWIDGGLAGGYGDGTFRPNEPITRAEFMAFVNRAFGFEEEGNAPFTDVPADAWYAPVIRQAMAAGYLTGYPDGTVRPNNPITRQEAAVIITKVLDLAADLGVLDRFTDSDGIPAWSRSFVSAVVKAGLMSGYPDGTFGAVRNITRAESLVALHNARGYTPPIGDDEDEEEAEEPSAVIPAPPGGRGSSPASFVGADMWSSSEYYYLGSELDVSFDIVLYDATLTRIYDEDGVNLIKDTDYQLGYDAGRGIDVLDIFDSYLSGVLMAEDDVIELFLVFDEGTANQEILKVTITGVVRNVYYVATDGDDENPGTLESPFATIQYAVSTATVGDTVYVATGTYVGDVFVPEDKDFLTISGNDMTTIQGDVTFEFVDNSNQRWPASVIMSGFTVTGTVKIVPGIELRDMWIGGDLIGYPGSGGALITDVTVVGDLAVTGSELVMYQVDVSGNAVIGGPFISAEYFSVTGAVYGAALYDFLFNNSVVQQVYANYNESQDAYFSFRVGHDPIPAYATESDAALKAGRIITLEFDGMNLDPTAAWSVGVLSDVLDVMVETHSIVLTVKPGETLVAGTEVLVTATDGVASTVSADSMFFTAQRNSTSPWWGFEYWLRNRLLQNWDK